MSQARGAAIGSITTRQKRRKSFSTLKDQQKQQSTVRSATKQNNRDLNLVMRVGSE